ncbi:MAG: manganese ABC transporter ATP-binding protein [Cyclobacteriaceae bacterium]|nr:MAG: manganese ABC transporter ATP-binding protein [Cyclobacteriaceae bacterium]
MDYAIEIHDLTVAFDRKPVLWNIDAHLPAGKLIGILGPNGAGKSTLIKTIMGLIPAGSGYVKIFGQPLKEVRKRVSYVPQRETIDWDFPVSVMDVALMGRYAHTGMFGKLRRADRDIALDALRKVGMEAFANRQIGRLSGGQQQRTFLARALAQRADLYLMDEPFAGVDAATEKAVITLLREMTTQGKTVLVVHHNLQSARQYFDHLLLLNTRLVACGPAPEVFTPDNLRDTYGGNLTLLTDVANLMHQEQHPVRENKLQQE